MKYKVRPKKHLGQHFLKEEALAEKIANSLSADDRYKSVLEIGPGMGVLTKYLLPKYGKDLSVVELDTESVHYLNEHYPDLRGRIIEADFLKTDLQELLAPPFAIIGNFPYNISSQILFRVYDNREDVPEVVGMFQREVALRITSPPGNKTYGILSVLLGAFYDMEYLFTVDESAFHPPPKVKSAVIRLVRNDTPQLDCDEKLFFQVVKQGFNQRRKTLRNALKSLMGGAPFDHPFSGQRAEQLSVQQFIELTRWIASQMS